MPRRPPPTSLRLHKGPIPGRGQAKHTLPSVPRPVHVPTDISRTISRAAPEPPAAAAGAPYNTVYDRMYAYPDKDRNANMSYRQPRRRSVERGLDTSGLKFPSVPGSIECQRRPSATRTRATITTGLGANGSYVSLSPMTTPSPGRTPSPQPPMRGPWDHSRAVSLPIDVGSVLAMPKPVAISP